MKAVAVYAVHSSALAFCSPTRRVQRRCTLSIRYAGEDAAWRCLLLQTRDRAQASRSQPPLALRANSFMLDRRREVVRAFRRTLSTALCAS